MRALYALAVAAALAAPAPVLAQTLHPTVEAVEKGAPVVSCLRENTFEGWCFVRFRLENGTMVSVAVQPTSEGLKSSWRWLDGPRFSSR